MECPDCGSTDVALVDMAGPLTDRVSGEMKIFRNYRCKNGHSWQQVEVISDPAKGPKPS